MTVTTITLVTISIMIAYLSAAAGGMVFILLNIRVMTHRACMTIRDIGLNVHTVPVESRSALHALAQKRA